MVNIQVQSSNLKSAAYTPERRTLRIEFRHGGVYEYYDVPESVYCGLISAESKGRYFWRVVRGGFAYRKVA